MLRLPPGVLALNFGNLGSFKFISYQLSPTRRWGTASAEVIVPPVEYPELSNNPSDKPRVS